MYIYYLTSYIDHYTTSFVNNTQYLIPQSARTVTVYRVKPYAPGRALFPPRFQSTVLKLCSKLQPYPGRDSYPRSTISARHVKSFEFPSRLRPRLRPRLQQADILRFRPKFHKLVTGLTH